MACPEHVVPILVSVNGPVFDDSRSELQNEVAEKPVSASIITQSIFFPCDVRQFEVAAQHSAFDRVPTTHSLVRGRVRGTGPFHRLGARRLRTPAKYSRIAAVVRQVGSIEILTGSLLHPKPTALLALRHGSLEPVLEVRQDIAEYRIVRRIRRVYGQKETPNPFLFPSGNECSQKGFDGSGRLRLQAFSVLLPNQPAFGLVGIKNVGNDIAADAQHFAHAFSLRGMSTDLSDSLGTTNAHVRAMDCEADSAIVSMVNPR